MVEAGNQEESKVKMSQETNLTTKTQLPLDPQTYKQYDVAGGEN